MELRQEYESINLKIRLNTSKLPRSSFYEWKEKLEKIDLEELELIDKMKEIISKSKGTYGYRRVTYALKKQKIIINHKKVLRLMRENELLCKKFHRKNKRYSSYKGEIGKISDNLLDRNFRVDKANKVWVSDITEFKIHQSETKLYLSPIMDLFNREIISYSISTSPTVAFTNKSLKEALKKLPANHKLLIHTDQGFHYQHISWVKILEENKIIQSMSRRGNCLDNSPMENFFGLLKQEIYYGIKYTSAEELSKEIERYID